MIYHPDKWKWQAVATIILIFSLGFALGHLFGEFLKPSSGVETLPVGVYYQENTTVEARISSEQVFIGAAVLVTFKNLDPNTTYYISMAAVGKIKVFNETEEITIGLAGFEDNWCVLGSQVEFRDIVWVWVGNPDDDS